MRKIEEIQERLDRIKKRMASFEEEYKNGNISTGDYTNGMDLLEEKEAMLEWVLNK